MDWIRHVQRRTVSDDILSVCKSTRDLEGILTVISDELDCGPLTRSIVHAGLVDLEPDRAVYEHQSA